MKQKLIGGAVALVFAFGLFVNFAPSDTVKTYTGIDTSPKEVIQPQSIASSETTDAAFDSKSNYSESAGINVPVPSGEITRHGVIEVGASGFNSFVVDIDKNQNWALVDKQFGESLAYEGFATTSDVKQGLKKYLSSIFTKGVAGRNVHFIISSGALKHPKTDLIAKTISQDGYVVNKATADSEGKQALLASLPKEYYNNGFSIDMGSGNTKVSWIENNKARTIEVVGAKYYQNGISDSVAADQLAMALAKVPDSKKAYCFIIGGVPFQLAKEVRTGDERFTLLKEPNFYKAENDVKLKSGLNLYREIYKTGAKPIFDWDANFTIGFLLNLKK